MFFYRITVGLPSVSRYPKYTPFSYESTAKGTSTEISLAPSGKTTVKVYSSAIKFYKGIPNFYFKTYFVDLSFSVYKYLETLRL